MKKAIRILYDHPFLLFVLFVTIAYLPVLLPFFHLKNDLVTQNLPTRFVISQSVYSGYFPWWNPYIYFGIPQYGDMNNGFWNPFIWIISKTTGYNIWTITLEEIFYILVGGWGLYKICREFFTKETALLTGLAYMASGYTIGHLQHFCWITGTAFFPYVLLYFIRVHKNPIIKNFVLGGMAVFFFLAATHPGLIIGSLYFFIFLIPFILFNRKRYGGLLYGKKFWLINILFLLFGLLISTIVIVSNLDVLQHISRGLKLSQDQQLLNPTTLQSYISLLVPLAVHQSDFFATDISMRNVYIGIAGLLGFIGFIKYYPKPIVIPASFALLFFILLSSGGIFKIIFSKILPLIGYVRMNGEFTYFVVLLLLLTGAAGFSRFSQISNTKPFIRRALLLLAAVFVSIAVISLVFILGSAQNSGLQKISAAGDFKTIIKALIDSLTIPYLLLIGSLLQFVTVISLKKFFSSKPLAYSVLIVNLIITTWLILPYTGLGMKSKLAIDKSITLFDKGIHAPELRSLDSTRYLDAATTNFLWMRSSYSKKIGFTPIELYPVQLRTNEVFLGDTALVSFINKQSYLFLSDDTTLPAKTNFDSSLIKVVSFAPGHVKTFVRPGTYKYITLLQNNYPYWKVRINGKDVPHFTGYKTFISAVLQQGDNVVEFIFDPQPIRISLWISIGSMLLGITLLLQKGWRNKKLFIQ